MIGVIPWNGITPKGIASMFVICQRMGLRPIRQLVRQWLTKPLTGTGHESGSPEMATETTGQALWGAAGAKTGQCAKA